MSKAVDHQPDPLPGQRRVLDVVIQDFIDRAEAGKERYGTYLQTQNKRDALWDLAQELMDAVMYVRQRIIEIEDDPAYVARDAEIQRLCQALAVFADEDNWRVMRNANGQVAYRFSDEEGKAPHEIAQDALGTQVRRTTKTTGGPGPVSPDEFVKVWQSSESLAEVATRLKMTKDACRSRAEMYRRKGVPLQDLRRRASPHVNWNGVAAVAADVARTNGAKKCSTA